MQYPGQVLHTLLTLYSPVAHVSQETPSAKHFKQPGILHVIHEPFWINSKPSSQLLQTVEVAQLLQPIGHTRLHLLPALFN